MEIAKRAWSTPQLTIYGDVQEITGDITVTKKAGSGDSIKVVVNNNTIVVPISGSKGGSKVNVS